MNQEKQKKVRIFARKPRKCVIRRLSARGRLNSIKLIFIIMQEQYHQSEATTQQMQSAVPSGSGKNPRRKTNPWIYVIIALCVLVPACLAGGFYYYTNQKDSEQQAYEVLEQNENVEDYENYLSRFPNGAHAYEVSARLKQLRIMLADWQRISNSAYASDFERFKQNYPQSLLVKQCDLKIDSLDWENAKKINTPEAMAAYQAKHPDGRYAGEASEAQNSLANTIVSADERAQIAETFHNFFRAFGDNNEAELFMNITPVMTQFLSKKNATKADVGNIMRRTYSDDIESCSFVVNDDFQIKKTVSDDGIATYAVTCSVDQHIAREGTGKTFGSYTVTGTVNAEMKISSLTMKEVSRTDQ